MRPRCARPRTQPSRSPRALAPCPSLSITGSGGLIGSESVAALRRGRLRRDRHRKRHARDVLRAVGLDARPDRAPERSYPTRSARSTLDIRDADGDRPPVRRAMRGELELVVHTAAQPSHDWAASDPQTDFTVNANGTLNLLEAARATRRTRPSSSARPTRSTATRRTTCRSRTSRSRLELPAGHRYARRHRHVDVDRRLPRTRCSASPRPPPTCSCRSTGATSTCRPSASAAAASPGPTTPARSCTASSPT